MEGVLRLYALKSEDLPAGTVRLCMDERPCQLLDEVMTPIAPKPGKVKKVDNEYKRQGTCTVFVAYDIDRGLRYTEVRDQRTKKDYAQFMDHVLATHYPNAVKVKLVQDNLNTHDKGSFYEHLSLQRAGELSELIDFVFTPKHGSWLNMAEIEFSAMSRQCLDRRIGSVEALREELQPWTAQRNEKKVRINWSFTVEKARDKLKNRYKEAVSQN